MEAVGSSKMLISTYEATHYHIPQDCYLDVTIMCSQTTNNRISLAKSLVKREKVVGLSEKLRKII
jgi:hypothetical protein